MVRTFFALASLALLGCVLSAWLFWRVAPSLGAAGSGLGLRAIQSQAERDALVADGLAGVLVGGDYGEVQDMLARFSSAGFFANALVVNASNRVVAAVGSFEGVRIGDAPPERGLQAARKADVSFDASKHGEVWIVGAATETPAPVNTLIAGVYVATILALLLAVVAAALATRFWWRAHGGGATAALPQPAAPRATHSTIASAPGSRDAGDTTAEGDEGAMARLVYANQLNRMGRKEEAIRQLELAQEAGIIDPNLQYVMGLAYFEVGVFDKAVEFAHRAYQSGYTLPGLKNKLVAAGHWRDSQHG